MTTMRDYYRPVVNQAGYILFFPNVGSEDDLIQSYPPNPYAESEIQLFPLGTKLMQGERVWRYSKAGGTGLNIAEAQQSAIEIHADIFPDLAIAETAEIGATEVVITSTGNIDISPLSEKDGFKDGYFLTQDLTGESQMIKIKGHDAFSTSDDEVLTLYDPLTIALDNTTQCGIYQNPYTRLLATTNVLTGLFIGVPLIAVTANYYFWCQTGGPAPGIPDGAIPIGDMVAVGTSAAKFSIAGAFTTEAWVGKAMTLATANGEAFMVFLTEDR